MLEGSHVVIVVSSVVFALVDWALVQLRDVGDSLAMVGEPRGGVEHAVKGGVITVYRHLLLLLLLRGSNLDLDFVI